LAFDWVVVLEDGRIAEQGSPDQLMGRDGLYRAMYRRQQEQETLPPAG
jgi:ABC-type multidrug transport system fused ATPase/permease subunit